MVISTVTNNEKRINAEFYKTESSNEPVKDELLKLGKPIKTIIGEDIKFVEYNWKIDRPYVDQLRQGTPPGQQTIYEVRSSLIVGNTTKQFRTLFFVFKKAMILVHFFEKKTKRTPLYEIDLAWDRMKKWIKYERSK